MSLVVNHNLMAANTARNLNTHYGRLATSTQRLSSGLRINGAADDAAGLAIRELMRADVAALHQGVRNANDAISLLQTADGALGIIDEKLIRMKELAEQAATGTYNSTQRLMIESEYQAMASEITRIANATDFNGLKLLNGNLAGDHDGSKMVSQGKMKIHFGTGNDSAEDYYYIEIEECTSQALGIGNASTWQDVQARAVDAFKKSLKRQIKESTFSTEDKTKLLDQIEKMGCSLDDSIKKAIDPENAYNLWTAGDDTLPDNRLGYDQTKDDGFLFDGKYWPGNSDLLKKFLDAGGKAGGIGTISSHMAAKDILEKMKNNLDDRLTQLMQLAPGLENYHAVDAIQGLGEYIISPARWEFFRDEDITTLKNQIKEITKPFEDFLRSLPEYDAWDTSTIDGLQEKLEAVIDRQQEAASRAEERGALLTDCGIRYPEELVEIMDIAVDNVKIAIQSLEADPNTSPADKNELDLLMPDIIKQAIKTAGTGHDLWEEDILDLFYWVEGSCQRNTGNFFTGTPPTFNTHDPGVWTAFEADWKMATGDTKNPGFMLKEIANFHQDWAWARLAEREGKNPNPVDPANIPDFWNNLREPEKQKLLYAFGHAAIYNLAHAEPANIPSDFGIEANIDDLAALAGLNDADDIAKAAQITAQALKDMYAKVGHMDFAGYTIETQEDAQMALEAITNAIIAKDKARAHLGALQNRLENTVTNLNIQAENLQASESRISDVDVATAMTNFVRNQILTQSAVAMLSQANTLPQMAMQLIGG